MLLQSTTVGGDTEFGGSLSTDHYLFMKKNPNIPRDS